MNDTQGTLADYRVVELGTGSALAYAGKLLAAFGAEVIKLEPDAGDALRLERPLVDVGEGRFESAYFAWLNVGKASVHLDDAAAFALIAGSDIVLDARPLAMMRSGALAHDALREANRALVLVAMSWFGERGPYRNYLTTDATCRALAGLVSLIGPVERPVGINDHQADIVGGLSAYIAALTGLLSSGRRFELSLHEALITLSETHTAYGPDGPRTRLGNNHFSGTFPLGVYRCREGWLGVGVSSHAQWLGFCELFGMTAASKNPAYALGTDRSARKDEIEPLFVHKLLERTAGEWFEEGLKRRLPLAIVPEMGELLAQPIFRASGAFATVGIGSARFEAPAIPFRPPACPPASSGTAAPLHGSSLPTANRRPKARPAHRRGGAPLGGMRIVDLTMGWAGPLVTRTLADLGAEVIKVEACAHPDWWRGQDVRPAFFEQKLYEKRPNFLCMNRNKLGITLDLTTDAGVALVKRLVARADAVVENYAYGVAAKLGLGYPALKAVKSDIVMVSMPAFRAGPWQDARAYGFTLEQASGLPSVAGNPEGPPLLTHYAYGDPIGGLNAAAGLLTALMHHRSTGEGQHVELSQVECMLPLTAPWMIEQAVTGRVSARLGNRHPRHVPHNCFRCAGDDRFVHIAVTDDAMWPRLCAVMGRPDWAADHDLARARGRRIRESELEAGIEAWTSTRDADDIMRDLQSNCIVAGVVRSPYDLVSDPHLEARGFWRRAERAYSGTGWHSSLAFRESEAPYALRRPAPTLGEDNEAVLCGILGLDAEQFNELEEQGVIGTAALAPTRKRKR